MFWAKKIRSPLIQYYYYCPTLDEAFDIQLDVIDERKQHETLETKTKKRKKWAPKKFKKKKFGPSISSPKFFFGWISSEELKSEYSLFSHHSEIDDLKKKKKKLY